MNIKKYLVLDNNIHSFISSYRELSKSAPHAVAPCYGIAKLDNTYYAVVQRMYGSVEDLIKKSQPTELDKVRM